MSQADEEVYERLWRDVLTQEKYITVMQAADEMHLDPGHVRRLCINGRIEGARKAWGGIWMIPTPVIYLNRRPGGRPKEKVG